MLDRRSDIILLLCSLLLAAGMWLVHILSQSYYAYLPFNVSAVSGIEGYAPRSTNTQSVFCGGKASGFFILGYNLSGKDPQEIDVEVSPSSFGVSDSSDFFTVRSSQISDRISESVNSFFEATYIPETELKFRFEPQTSRKVPVVSRIGFSCRSQYMQTGEVRLEPDSVTVYGNESDLVNVTSVRTKSIALGSLDRSTRGMVAIDKYRNLRIVPGSVTYSVPVGRYFEYTYKVALSPVNVPSDKTLILLPSTVEVSCRLPFGTAVRDFVDNAVFVVDYDEVAGSRSSKVAPRMEDSDIMAYSCSFEPQFVDCIISEAGK